MQDEDVFSLKNFEFLYTQLYSLKAKPKDKKAWKFAEASFDLPRFACDVSSCCLDCRRSLFLLCSSINFLDNKLFQGIKVLGIQEMREEKFDVDDC